jgi:hypothetical protein
MKKGKSKKWEIKIIFRLNMLRVKVKAIAVMQQCDYVIMRIVRQFITS